MIATAGSIDWASAAREAPQFATTMVVVGALSAAAGLPSEGCDELARTRERALRRIACTGAVASLLELFTYRFPATVLAAVGRGLRHFAIASVTNLPTPNAETGVRLGAIVLSLAAFVTMAYATRSTNITWYRLALAFAWIGVLTDLALAIVRVYDTHHWRWPLHPLHLLGAGLWIGTLAVILFVIPQRCSSTVEAIFAAQTIRRFSPLAMTSAALLATTGVASAAHRVNIQQLGSSEYGRVLLAKLFFVSIVAACGAWNWRHFRPSLERNSVRARFGTAFIELGASVAVVAAAAVLLSTSSPR